MGMAKKKADAEALVGKWVQAHQKSQMAETWKTSFAHLRQCTLQIEGLRKARMQVETSDQRTGKGGARKGLVIPGGAKKMPVHILKANATPLGGNSGVDASNYGAKGLQGNPSEVHVRGGLKAEIPPPLSLSVQGPAVATLGTPRAAAVQG